MGVRSRLWTVSVSCFVFLFFFVFGPLHVVESFGVGVNGLAGHGINDWLYQGRCLVPSLMV